MRLHYKVLVFDDDLTWVEGIKGDIVEIVENEGFLIDPEKDIDHYYNRSSFHGNYDKYDMILVDYDLRSEHGDTILENIRSHQHYTDVIFYTQGDDVLSRILYEKGIQGVYWSSRIHCPDKFSKVFQNSVKKVLDLNNLRGLVMAEASILDELKSAIFRQSLEYNLINRDFFEQRLFIPNKDMCWKNYVMSEKYLDKKVTKEIDSVDCTYKDYDENKFMSKSFLFSFDLKAKTLKHLLDEIGSNKVFDHHQYFDKIQDKRNKLAHAVEDETTGNIVYGNYNFNLDEARILFNDLKSYNDLFEAILEEIKQKGITQN